MFAVSPVDRAVVVRALTLGFADFEDAITAAVAEADGCGAVVSRDAVGFRSSPLAVLDAEAALTAIGGAARAGVNATLVPERGA